MSKLTLLTFPATMTAARMILEGARREISARLLGPECKAERFAVRGAALKAIEELYYEGITEAARNRLRRIKPPKGKDYLSGRDALLDLAGWDSVP